MMSRLSMTKSKVYLLDSNVLIALATAAAWFLVATMDKALAAIHTGTTLLA
jgi:hypothetical protein